MFTPGYSLACSAAGLFEAIEDMQLDSMPSNLPHGARTLLYGLQTGQIMIPAALGGVNQYVHRVFVCCACAADQCIPVPRITGNK